MLKIRKKTLIPVCLLLVFIIPVIMGYMLYGFRNIIPLKTTNYGSFLNPTLKVAVQPGKWQMLYLCNTQCAAVSFSLNQIKKALGKDSERVIVQVSSNEAVQLPINRIYLVDPLGNAFMYYAATENPMHILKDIKKVLGVSQIG